MKYLILFFIPIFTFMGCGRRQKTTAPVRTLTVTIEPQRFFVEAIAGDRFKVNTMVPKGSSPETYDPIPQQLVSLQDSEAYLRIGYIGFEQSWMQRIVQNNPHLRVFDTSIGVEVIRGSNEMHDHHGTHTYPGGVEPHIWNSTINAQVIAKNILSALCTLDPSGRDFYRQRYDSLSIVIAQTDSIIQQILANGQTDQAFMIFHPALSYFARDYHLTQVSIEEDGREPSPAHLKEIIELCRAEHIRIIFIQPEFDRRHAEIIAEQTQTTIVPINPLSYAWADEMIHVAQALNQTATP